MQCLRVLPSAQDRHWFATTKVDADAQYLGAVATARVGQQLEYFRRRFPRVAPVHRPMQWHRVLIFFRCSCSTSPMRNCSASPSIRCSACRPLSGLGLLARGRLSRVACGSSTVATSTTSGSRTLVSRVSTLRLVVTAVVSEMHYELAPLVTEHQLVDVIQSRPLVKKFAVRCGFLYLSV
jgi:hypothetical protein